MQDLVESSDDEEELQRQQIQWDKKSKMRVSRKNHAEKSNEMRNVCDDDSDDDESLNSWIQEIKINSNP